MSNTLTIINNIIHPAAGNSKAIKISLVESSVNFGHRVQMLQGKMLLPLLEYAASSD
ncbi:MAG TPA: hypothetical protein VJR94_11075 [Candidatus Nitrosocosmicus sp.]|nr:hypothetical protein [Candidatus Nitrosocosmicus sp.]